ncbi:MAG: hypothetical protein B9S33_05865 [Pedosphaera sp. Tous-C6FEB]|nr:MAG: hypothetical protein B9S33_05865 [Pedosphaera sp. Tous-C6FEB]
MRHPILQLASACLAIGLVASCDLAAATVPDAAGAAGFRAAYAKLLPLFPEDAPGRGLDRGDASRQPQHQPMTYGLLLSAESLRQRVAPQEAGRRRVRQTARWLVANQDLDGDGKPGWGLPQAWQHRPVNTPYTITTAVVLEGFLDTLTVPKLWTPVEREELLSLTRATTVRWCRELWAEGFDGGFFHYSPHDAQPAWFCVNAPGMFLGVLARLLHEHADALPAEEQRLIAGRRDALVRALVSQATLREGAPYWKYIATPNPLGSDRANDLIHQVYILWGLETFRDAGGRLPWSRAQAVASVARYWKGERLCFYPYDEVIVKAGNREAPTNLWGAGMLLAFEARWGAAAQASRCFAVITKDYGPFPRLRVLPREVSEDGDFYPRDVAHVLFGLAHAALHE